ncbi:hypothetical protein HMPREF0018_02702 [Acinetobacter radioresistens SH164]|nr:hypothetical protein HMPREF0018_02702 [Acinetobacter radioresistens SH164]
MWIYTRSEHVLGCPVLGVSTTKTSLSAAEIEKFFWRCVRYQAARDIHQLYLLFDIDQV